MKSNLIDLACQLVHETERAWLLDFGGDKPVWIPKSAAEFDASDNICTMPERWALDKGLI